MGNWYKTLAEAAAAARALGITGAVDYIARRREDPRLPSTPALIYKEEWLGFPAFLGKVGKFYPTLDQASAAARALGIPDSIAYEFGYKRDPRLPRYPMKTYKSEWRTWESFLAIEQGRRSYYSYFLEASAAVKRLAILNEADYSARRHFDKKLPDDPALFYGYAWRGWDAFTGCIDSVPQSKLFTTFDLARSCAHSLRAVSSRDYRVKIAGDERFSPAPDLVYAKDWKGWNDFLGKVDASGKYATYEEARAACRALKFQTSLEYKNRINVLDRRLPGSPNKFYGDDWTGWHDYLGTKRGKDFYSYEDARARVLSLGIKSPTEYLDRYREDLMLPSSPNMSYRGSWTGWAAYLSQEEGKHYGNLKMAREGALRLGITTALEYKARYQEDPRLPSNPNIMYAAEWCGFPLFLRGRELDKKYETIEEASEAAKKHCFESKKDYLSRYKIDPALPSNPNTIYAKSWAGWGWARYLGREGYTYKEAGAAARRLGLYSRKEYRERYKEDPLLPAEPSVFYKGEWVDWHDFILPEKCKDLAEAKFVVKVLAIANSREYRERYKNYSCLPANPDRVFSAEWKDWFDFCDIPVPYSYDELRALVVEGGVRGQMDYNRFVIARKDPRMPRDPQTVYSAEWISWFSFVDKAEPFKTKYIRYPYTAWADSINEFLQRARGGDGKHQMLCRFVREYIERYELGYTPEVYFTSAKIDLNLFENVVNNSNGGTGRQLLTAVKEFADYIIRKKLTLEDEETGERVVVHGARNPFLTLVYEGEEAASNAGETNKNALAYQHVKATCDWIVPESAQCFADLAHLHEFDADWVEVDPSVIDKDDPDCIFKIEFGKTKLWFPVYWMHTYALASVPARGRQLAYNDSGEADSEIPHFVNGEFVWKKNPSTLSGMTTNQGFVKRYPNDRIGMRFTSNKTSRTEGGYDVPWMPERLAVWMIRLRNWQAKYNPITRPMPWLECTRTELNPSQRKRRGVNCFLFRDYGDEECGHYQGRLKSRLAAALYHSQPEGLKLAECSGGRSSLSTYSTSYSPHSMRVSLITAYVMEFGLPIDVIMKVAGHSSIIMSIYYVKMNAEGLRVKFAEGEKRALSNQAYAAIQLLEQNRIDEIRHELIQNNEQALQRYSGNALAGSMLFRDYGFCVFAGTRCEDGGALIGATQVRQPVPGGYLGVQNCPRCRHLVTGPVFIGGLLALANEVSLQASLQFDHIEEMNRSIAEASSSIDDFDDMEYEASKAAAVFDPTERTALEMRVRKMQSELESAAKKADMFLCDLQAISRLINQSQALIHEQSSSESGTNLPQLILQQGHELEVAFEDSSRYRLLNEVCENAEIYQSASADSALPVRSQMIDKMIELNRLKPTMFKLDKKQQLAIGNQLTNFLLARVKSWEKVDDLFSGRLLLDDLGEHERIMPTDLEAVLSGRSADVVLEQK